MAMITQRTFLKMLAASPLSMPGGANAAIDWDEAQQTIDGFGVSVAFHQARNLQNFPEP